MMRIHLGISHGFKRADGTIREDRVASMARLRAQLGKWPDEDREPESWQTVGASDRPFGRLPSPAELSVDDAAACDLAFCTLLRLGREVLDKHAKEGDHK